jgi:DNA invertase Pin-like site-specific DNA recombinase
MTGNTIPQCYSYLRFSTPQQLQGDSLRRQLEASQKWAEQNGFILDEKLSMRDLGLSAYSGSHKTKGALGGFLKAVDEGLIAPGSILIVESLDRLSREQIMDALSQFTNIINKGIEIVTLCDNMRYSLESIKQNWAQLIVSLSIMARAHEESDMKAQRTSAAWDTKRKNLETKKAATVGPTWLRYNKKAEAFNVIPEHAEIVRRIFQMSLDGTGVHVIRERLNAEGLRTFKNKKPFRKGVILRLLKDRSVIGEYQPNRVFSVNGVRKKEPVGEPIKGYYPAVISEEIFHAVQQRIQERKRKGGRTGIKLNLFRYLLKCGYCGKAVVKVSKGRHEYLLCDASKINVGCKAGSWNIAEFEAAFLNECRELDVASILPNGNGRAAKIKAAQQAVDAVQGELTELKKRIANMEKTIELAESEAVISLFIKKLDTALAEKKDAENRLSTALMDLNATQLETESTDGQLKSLQDLIHTLENYEGQDLIQLREKLKNSIAGLVDHIDVFPDGLGDRIITGDAVTGYKLVSANDLIGHWENIGNDSDIFKPGEHDALIGELTAYEASNTGKQSRAFVVHFKAGGWRLVRREGKEYVNEVSTMEAILNYANNQGETVRTYLSKYL